MRSFSLIPKEEQASRGIASIPRNVLSIIAVLVVILVVGGGYTYSLQNSASDKNSTIQTSNQGLQEANKEVNSVAVKVSALAGTNVEERVKLTRDIVRARPDWDQLFTRILAAAKGRAHISSIQASYNPAGGTTDTATSNYDVNLSGTSPGKVTLVRFVRALRKIKPEIASVTLLTSNKTESNGAKLGLSFTIGIKLHKNSSGGIPPDLLSGTDSGSTPPAGGTQ